MKITSSISVLAAAALGVAVLGLGPVQASQDKPVIIMVSGPLTDPFFSAVKKGFDDAAAAMKVDAQYSTISTFDNVQSDLVHLVEASASRRPDALIVGDFFPDAMDPAIKAAVAQGTAVIIHNSGEQSWKSDGALTYIGEDPRAMGAASGELAVKNGVKFGLCVDHVPGNPALEQRCSGYEDALKKIGGGAKVLSISTQDAQNPQANLQAIKGALQADPKINGILTLGATQTAIAVQAVREQGLKGKVTIGATDLSSAGLAAEKVGDVAFLVDQQAYLQGFYSVVVAAQYVKYGLHPIGEIHTGPLVVTKDNIDRIIEVDKKYGGIRGAQ
ncbi:MAG TPA: sugar ABC transporter substrate-binding protein [Roseiarcus sp.]|nr:sugar ABC transporter substrate-binding protein [Roseiarcus sp.]